MENNPIFKIFESFPRQGPGDDEHTEKAFSIIAEPQRGGGDILDVWVREGRTDDGPRPPVSVLQNSGDRYTPAFP